MLARIRRREDGWVFSAADFVDLGSRAAVDKALSRMSTGGLIRRVGRGLFRPEVQRSVPDHPWHLSLAMNAAFAKFWGQELGQPGWVLPYQAAGVAAQGEALLRQLRERSPNPSEDRALIDSWAEELGLNAWLQWIPYSP